MLLAVASSIGTAAEPIPFNYSPPDNFAFAKAGSIWGTPFWMYTPKVSETHKINKSRLYPVILRGLSISIIKGGCSGKASPQKRFDNLVTETAKFAKIFKDHKQELAPFKCGKAKAVIVLKGKNIIAAERVIPMPKATWKEYVCFLPSDEGNVVWELRYASSEPAYTKNKAAVLESLKSFKLP